MNQNYYSGGFAEFVDSPTPLTYSFLRYWFTGEGSIGKAMEILDLPFEKNQTPILELINGELLVNLKIEEETLYKKTIFKYALQKNTHHAPRLIADFKKIINLICIANTSKIIITQSKWISKPNHSVDFAKKLINTIPVKNESLTLDSIDTLLTDKIWPVVIAVGLLSEFYTQLLIKDAGKDIDSINTLISTKLAQRDWFFKSISDQEKVKQNQMSFNDYITIYGLRADNDYELTSPRWHEVPDVIKKRIGLHKNALKLHESIKTSEKMQKLIDTSVEFQLLRSTAKQKALLFIDILRSAILQKTQTMPDISTLTRENLINGNISQHVKQNKFEHFPKNTSLHSAATSGKGVCVSQGNVIGISINIEDNEKNIPVGTIGIFPNASPEFAPQYPKCVGLIFLKGGLTSHGAIVAREFGIPAIIDSNARSIKDGSEIKLNSTTGKWQIL